VSRCPGAVAVGCLLLASLAVPGCSGGGPAGLGARRWCQYLRPRLVRIDRDLAALETPALVAPTGAPPAGGAPAGGAAPPTAAGAAADLGPFATDIATYVTQLPAAGTASSDRPLVRVSSALAAFVAPPGPLDPPPAATAELRSAERAVKRTCHVR